jgi:hypothetical protein
LSAEILAVDDSAARAPVPDAGAAAEASAPTVSATTTTGRRLGEVMVSPR